MGMCKECGKVFSAIEMKDGYCKECLPKNKENPEQKSSSVVTYEEKMIESFVGNSRKYDWYTKSFSKFNIDGMPTMKWNWSWWAFFGSFWFLMYRKAYLAALGAFLLIWLSLLLPNEVVTIYLLIVYILIGGYSTYFIYKVYKKKKNEIENNIDDKQKCIETMKRIDGHNKWVITLSIIFFVIAVLASVAIPKLANDFDSVKLEHKIIST